MANSPVDKSNAFIESGMTLITEPTSDRYLKKINRNASHFSNAIKSKEGGGNQKG